MHHGQNMGKQKSKLNENRGVFIFLRKQGRYSLYYMHHQLRGMDAPAPMHFISGIWTSESAKSRPIQRFLSTLGQVLQVGLSNGFQHLRAVVFAETYPPMKPPDTNASEYRRRLGAEFGGTEQIFRGPKFQNDVFQEKMSILTPKISDDLFLVIDRLLSVSSLSLLSETLYMLIYTII